MIPQTYPSVIEDGTRKMVVYTLSSVTGLKPWVDYIPVKSKTTGPSNHYDGFIEMSNLNSTTGKTAWQDYIPIYVDASATVEYSTNAGGYIPATIGPEGGIAGLFLPSFLQASPAGYQGSFRSVTGHTSINMWNAACNMTAIECTVSNALFWTSGAAAEGIPSDGANINITAVLYTPRVPLTRTTRNFNASLASGATSGTLAANAPASAWEYVEFSNGERRWVRYTGSSTAATWDTPLSSACTNVARIWTLDNRGAFLFNGVSPGVLTGGVQTTLKGVISGLSVNKDDPVIVNFYLSRVGGGSFLMPASQPANLTDIYGNALKECYTDSVTNYANTKFGTAPFNAVLTGGINQYRPVSLRGSTRSNTTMMETTVIGDSIGSTQSGWVQKFLHTNKIPFQNLCKAGEYASIYLLQNNVRKQVYGGRVALVEMGANSYSLAQLQPLWAHLRENGYTKIIQVLVTPNTSSGSTGWTAADQSDQVANPAIRTVSAQIVALVGQPDGPDAVIDTGTPCQGVDPDKWAPNLTADGIHPNGTAVDSYILPYLVTQNYQALFVAP
jgi:hypothetical protein